MCRAIHERFSVISLVMMIVLFFFLLVYPPTLSAIDYYVRPEGGSYGLGDGSGYDNAWDGLKSVLWGAGGVDDGDTLYICGTHIKTDPTSWSAQNISPASGSGSAGWDDESQRVIIRGDCSSVDASYEDGIIWGAYRYSSGWSSAGSNVYSHATVATSHASPNGLFAFYYPGDGTHKVMDMTYSLSEIQGKGNSTNGYMYYSGGTAYIKLPDQSTPSGNEILLERYGWKFSLNGKSYITIKNLTFYHLHGPSGGTDVWGLGGNNNTRNANHITWENNKIWYSEKMLFWPGSTNDSYWWIKDNDIGWAVMGGIYVTTRGGQWYGPNNFRITDNYIHDIGNWDCSQSRTDKDSHGIGWWGSGNNIEITGNHLTRNGSGITLYFSGSAHNNYDWTITHNYVHDNHAIRSPSTGPWTPCGGDGANDTGIEVNSDHNITGSQFTGTNLIAYNLVENLTITTAESQAYRMKQAPKSDNTPSWLFYNNVANNSYYSFHYSQNNSDPRWGWDWRNNISLNPIKVHMSTTQGNSGRSLAIQDYNIYYPDGNYFRYPGRKDPPYGTFSEYQDYLASQGVEGAEANSSTANPDLDANLRPRELSLDVIDFGANLGVPYKLGISNTIALSDWPTAAGGWNIATLDQDDYGSGWEIGAFVFGGLNPEPPSPPDPEPPSVPRNLRIVSVY